MEINTIQTKYGNAGISSDGYYRITSIKEGNLKKLLHRLIFEDYHNTTLSEDVIVHHKDGNKLNNDISNLEVMSKAEHAAFHNAKDGNPLFKDYPRIIKNGHYKGMQVYAIRYKGKRVTRSVDLPKLQNMLTKMQDEIKIEEE